VKENMKPGLQGGGDNFWPAAKSKIGFCPFSLPVIVVSTLSVV
jgi:hypothetical protein